MADITLVSSSDGDWMGVYRDGYLAYEGHSINPIELLRICDVPFRHKGSYIIEDGASLPPTLAQVR